MDFKNLKTNKNLYIFLFGVFISGIGSKLTSIALAIKILDISGQNLGIMLVFLFEGIPCLLFSSIGGYLADKYNKKTLMIIINILFGIISISLCMFNNIYLLYTLIFINGILISIYTPARIAIFPLLTSKDNIVQANGLRMSINGVIMILGYAFAGFLVSLLGYSDSFIIDGISFWILALMLLRIKLESKLVPSNICKEPELTKNKFFDNIKRGYEIIKLRPTLKCMFIVDILTIFVISMQMPLAYLFVKNYLGGIDLLARRSGLLFSCAGIGGVLGGLLIRKFKNKDKLNILVITIIFDSINVFLFANNTIFWVSMILFMALGVLSTFSGSLLEIYVQETIDLDSIGRVSGFINSIRVPTGIISIAVGGLLVSVISVKSVFIICSFLEFLVGIYFGTRILFSKNKPKDCNINS